MRSERIIYEVDVPTDQRSLADDTPNKYRVVIPEDSSCCCIVYGFYTDKISRGRWDANCSARWLVRHLIERLNELVELKEWHDSTR